MTTYASTPAEQLMSTDSTDLSQDLVFDLLSNRRRRFVLHYLIQENRPVSIQELSRQLAMWEFEAPAEELTDQQEKRIYVALYQTHLPKLEDAGVVDYDSDTGLVEISSQATQLQSYLDEPTEEERPWPWYYIGLAVASIVFYGATLVDLPVFNLFTEFTAGLIVVSAFIVLSLVHYRATMTE